MASEFSVSDKCRIKDVKVFTDKVLGTGSYGVVHKAVYHGTLVAAKKLHGIFFEGVSPAEFKGILHSWQKELELMSSLRHPNIVQFYGVYNSRDSSSLQLSGDSYIISELMLKSLQARNLEQSKLNFRQIVDIVMDIASGLCYLHNREHPIMHRDLASKNILLSVSGQAKIADLGVAKITLSAQTSHTRHPGTDLYMPVEAVIGSNDYDHSIDVYGLGVITLELSIGKDPTATQCIKRVSGCLEAVPEKERRQKDFIEYYRTCSKELEDVIMSCLEEKEARITATELVEKMEKLQKSNTYQLCDNIPIFKNLPTLSSGDESKLSAELEASKEKTKNLLKENGKLAGKFEQLQQQFQQLSNKNVELEEKLKDKEKELKELKNCCEAKSNELSQLQTYQHTMSTSNTGSFLHPTYNSLQRQQLSNSPKDVPVHIAGPEENRIYDQRSTYQRSHSAENYSTGINDQRSTYRRSHSTYAESSPVRNPSSVPNSPIVTGNCSSLPITYSTDLPLINLPNAYENRHSHDQATRSPLYHHQHKNDRSEIASQCPGIPPQVVTSNSAQLSTSAPLQITVREANEYLSYQVSCMDRVIGQLMNPNNSNNLQSSFVQTLKEQIIKTDSYIRSMPFSLRNEDSPIQRIECQLNKLLTANIRIAHSDRQELDGVIRRLGNTIGN